MRKLFTIISMAILIFGCSTPQHEEGCQKPEIRFKDGKLRIAQFTDVHWSDGEKDERLPKIIKSVVEAENPDLLVFTGDVVTGLPVVEGWTTFINFMQELGIPYAVTMGNHDPEAPSTSDPDVHWTPQQTRDSIFTVLEKSPLFVGERGPAELQGMGNYALPVLASDGSDKVKAVLYCLDSFDYTDDARLTGDYAWFSFDQILWYMENSKAYTASNGGKPLPSLAFFHIPLPEYREIKAFENTVGNRPEDVYCGALNSGMFNAMYEMKDVMGTFVGHDHNNDYIGQLGGIALAYGKKTGVSSYGDFDKGGRIIDMYEGERYFETWLRNEHGVKENVYYYPAGVSADKLENYKSYPAHDVNPQEKGVSYKYYEGLFKSVKDFESKGKLLDQGVMEDFDITGAKAHNHFGYEFTCWVEIPSSGLYHFGLSSDDGSLLMIDGETVVDNDGSHSKRYRDGGVRLEKGFHELSLRYFDDTSGQSLKVYVMGRGLSDLEGVLYVR